MASSKAARAMTRPRGGHLMRSASRPVITCLKPSPSTTADEILGWNGEVLKMKLASFQTLLYPNLSMSRLTVRPGAPFSMAKALMPLWAGCARRIGFSKQQEGVAEASVGDPHFGAVDQVRVSLAVATWRCLANRCPLRLGKADAAAFFAGCEAGQRSVAAALRFRSELAHRTKPSACR